MKIQNYAFSQKQFCKHENRISLPWSKIIRAKKKSSAEPKIVIKRGDLNKVSSVWMVVTTMFLDRKLEKFGR